MKLILKRTKKKCKGKFIYTCGNYTIKKSEGNSYWNIYFENEKNCSDCCVFKDIIGNIEIDIKSRNRLNLLEKSKGGWRCPKGCEIDHVVIPFSEVCYGTETCGIYDEDLSEPDNRDTQDWDNYETELPECPKCGKKVEWSNGENSLNFIMEEDNDKTNTPLPRK